MNHRIEQTLPQIWKTTDSYCIDYFLLGVMTGIEIDDPMYEELTFLLNLNGLKRECEKGREEDKTS